MVLYNQTKEKNTGHVLLTWVFFFSLLVMPQSKRAVEPMPESKSTSVAMVELQSKESDETTLLKTEPQGLKAIFYHQICNV